MATAAAHRLKWFTPEDATKGHSREWRAPIGADEEGLRDRGRRIEDR